MKTPCVKQCSLDRERGLCPVCRRTLEEIANWTSYTEAQREAIMAELDRREVGPGAAES
ncbi:MAG: DUF1289 domain-containing protein [Deltaproteobacteria bacterium]|nr:DUF1289 domain-containing protein [Deltaproteobacteria bacterium]